MFWFWTQNIKRLMFSKLHMELDISSNFQLDIQSVLSQQLLSGWLVTIPRGLCEVVHPDVVFWSEIFLICFCSLEGHSLWTFLSFNFVFAWLPQGWNLKLFTSDRDNYLPYNNVSFLLQASVHPLLNIGLTHRKCSTQCLFREEITSGLPWISDFPSYLNLNFSEPISKKHT